MQSLNRNGVSITQAPGEEKFVKYRPVAFKGRIFYQYDYGRGTVFHSGENAQSAATGGING